MKTLHRYLLSQVLATLVLTVGIFTAVLMMGNAMKEVLALVVKGQASLWGVTKAFGLLVPFVISFSLPMGLLTAMLLVFGRFSADQELTAARAGGVSLLSLVTPVIVFSLLMSGLCALINLEIAPRCRTAYKQLVYDLAKTNPSALLSENTFVTEVPDHVIYIGQLERDTANPHHWTMQNILLNRMDQGELIQRTRAARGEVEYNEATKQFIFRLIEAQVNVRADKLSVIFGGSDEPEEEETPPEAPATNSVTTNDVPEPETEAQPFPSAPEWMPMAGGEIILPITMADMEKRVFKPKLSYLTFGQLRRELQRHGEVLNVDSNGSTALVHYSTRSLPEKGLELEILRDDNSVGRARFNGDATPAHLVLEILEGDIRAGDRFALNQMPLKVQLHRQVSFSFAAIGFTLISIPLGIRTHRRETTAGVAMALVLILIYYSFVILGQALESKPHWHPHYLVWIPVFLFQFIGGWLLWRANRGT
mgnify:FL=1